MSIVIVFLFIFASNLRIVKTNHGTDKVKVLADFFKIRGGPTHINAFLYWDKEEIFALARMCFDQGIKLRLNRNESQFLDHPLDAAIQFNVVDTNFDLTSIILKQASQRGLLKKPFKWLTFGILAAIENIDFYPGTDSEFMVIEKYGNECFFTAIHKVNGNMQTFYHNKIGSWNEKIGVVHYEVLSFYTKRRNLNGSEFPLSFWASNRITYDTVGEYRYTHIDASIRFTYIISQLLTSTLNVKRTYIVHKDSYAGIFQDIKTGNAILGATPIFFYGNRLGWIDYMAPNTKSYLYFIFRAPPLSYVSNIFTRPFHRNVWYSSFAMIILIFAMMYLIVTWEWKEVTFRKTIENIHDTTKPSADDIAIVQMGIVSQQGSDTELKSTAGRIVFMFSLICFMFMYTAYSGMIVALLQSTSNLITTLDDLLNSGIDLGIEDLLFAIPYFKNATEPIKKEIYMKKLEPKGDKFIMSLNEGVEKMRTEFFAFHTEQTSAYKIVADTFQESEKCKLQEIQFVNIVEPWIIATKNHTYKELLKISLARLREVGFYNAERRRIFNEKPKCTSKMSSFVSAGIVDIYAAFLFFGVGLMITLVLFLMELTVKKYSERGMKKNGKKLIVKKYDRRF